MSVALDPHIQAISEQGYTILRSAIDPKLHSQALTQIQRDLQHQDTDLDAPRAALNLGDDLLFWNMQNRDFIFLKILFSCPDLLEIMRHFLNDPWYSEIPQSEPNYILHSYIARSSGQAPLRMHVDSLMVFPGPDTNALSTLLCLEDADVQNGTTRVVPGSHRAGRYVRPEDYDDAIPLEVHAGDVILFDSRLWHGAGPNQNGRSRWLLVATFVRWWMKQGFNITGSLPAEHYARLSATERTLLGYCAIPPETEHERFSAKMGHGDLAEDISDYRRRG